jgi:hypothetical protein
MEREGGDKTREDTHERALLSRPRGPASTPYPHLPHLGLRAEDDDVDGHVVFLQFFTDLDERGLILRDRGTHKQDDPLALVLVGPVFEGELGDLDGG